MSENSAWPKCTQRFGFSLGCHVEIISDGQYRGWVGTIVGFDEDRVAVRLNDPAKVQKNLVQKFFPKNLNYAPKA